MRHVPEPQLPLLNADKVEASREAYAKLSVGDAFIGFLSYGAIMFLAAAGGPDRHVTSRWLPRLLAVKAGIDATQAAKLTTSSRVFNVIDPMNVQIESESKKAA